MSVGLEVKPIYGSIRAELKEFYFNHLYTSLLINNQLKCYMQFKLLYDGHHFVQFSVILGLCTSDFAKAKDKGICFGPD